MPRTASPSKTADIFDRLLRELGGGRYQPGARLPTIRELCRRFDAKHYTVQSAVAKLAEAGYVERRHGSGTFVVDLRPAASISEAVALCVDFRGHLFGDLAINLMRRAQSLHQTVLPIDLSEDSAERAVLRAARSRPRVMIVQTRGGRSPASFEHPVVSEIPCVALFGQAVPGLTSVRWSVDVDHRRGAEIVADELWARGHRRVVLATGWVKPKAAPLPGEASWVRQAFAERWRDYGGEVRVCEAPSDPARYGHLRFDTDAFLDRVRGDAPPATAVFATRDVDAFDLQTLLQQRGEPALPELEWFGYGDTPWRLFTPAPLLSINWRLDRIADEVTRLLRDERVLHEGGRALIPPVLADDPDPGRLIPREAPSASPIENKAS